MRSAVAGARAVAEEGRAAEGALEKEEEARPRKEPLLTMLCILLGTLALAALLMEPAWRQVLSKAASRYAVSRWQGVHRVGGRRCQP